MSNLNWTGKAGDCVPGMPRGCSSISRSGASAVSPTRSGRLGLRSKRRRQKKRRWIVPRSRGSCSRSARTSSSNGVTLAGLSGDPMLADYLLHAGERSHSLADLASRYFNHRVIPISDLIGKGKSQLCIDQVPAARVAEYSGEDADFAWRLSQHLE